MEERRGGSGELRYKTSLLYNSQWNPMQSVGALLDEDGMFRGTWCWAIHERIIVTNKHVVQAVWGRKLTKTNHPIFVHVDHEEGRTKVYLVMRNLLYSGPKRRDTGFSANR